MHRAPFLAALLAALAAGCLHVGPRTIPQDRFEYGRSIGESWKQQALLNIVKLRYLDLPVFLDVSQIVSGYSLETGVSVTGQLSSPGAIQGDNVGLRGEGRFTDRPTITYSPLTGDQFLRAMLTPIPPRAVFFLLEAGYSPELVLGLMVESLNGLRNDRARPGGARPRDPGFARVMQLMTEVQGEGAIGLRVETGAEEGETAVIVFRARDLPEDVLAKLVEVRDLLGVESEAQRYRLIDSLVPGAPDELAVRTRSMIQILLSLATCVQVPEADVAERRTSPTLRPADPRDMPITVHCSEDEPAEAYASVRYRGRWFWIDDRDLLSKRAFVFLLFLFTLTDAGSVQNLPVLTIPAG
jgi:hypothetical protein